MAEHRRFSLNGCAAIRCSAFAPAASAFIIALVAGLVATILLRPSPRLVWNASASSPLGLYLVTPCRPLHVGDFAAARLPERMQGLASHRHYLPKGVPLVKRVAAIGGDRVCAFAAVLTINGQRAARLNLDDPSGRRLPRWRGCVRLPAGDVLLLSRGVADAFDGRYFGATRRDAIIGRAVLLWRR